jgi:2',3'-cyclic-nucleotide 2'-phosphodiesterase (5'-nucleotidase family)
VLKQTLEHALGASEARAHVSGIRVRIAPSNPPGQRVTSVTLADGAPIVDTALYTLAVPDFVAAGGSGYAMLRGAPSENTGVVDLDALTEYLRSLPQPVRPPQEVRVGEGGGP